MMCSIPSYILEFIELLASNSMPALKDSRKSVAKLSERCCGIARRFFQAPALAFQLDNH
jgi:hypothetical protein